MSGDVGEGVRCHPVIQGLGRMAAGREKKTNFCPPPPTVIRRDPLENPWKWAVLEGVPCGCPAGPNFFHSIFSHVACFPPNAS